VLAIWLSQLPAEVKVGNFEGGRNASSIENCYGTQRHRARRKMFEKRRLEPAKFANARRSPGLAPELDLCDFLGPHTDPIRDGVRDRYSKTHEHASGSLASVFAV